MDVIIPFFRLVRVDGALFMDKKVKKKTHVLQQRIQTLRQQLAGAKIEEAHVEVIQLHLDEPPDTGFLLRLRARNPIP